MREGIVRRNLLVEIDDTVIKQLLANGFHPLYGARPLQREIGAWLFCRWHAC